MIVAGGVTLHAGVHAYRVSSAAMSPTFVPGDLVVGETVVPATLRHGDVVLADPMGWGVRGPVLKRVIGTGGDRITCCASGHVTVDGKPLDEPYAPSADGGMPDFAVTVPAGRVFLLGDNRADSIDSRMFLSQAQGSLPASAVLSRVVWTSRSGFQGGASTTLLVSSLLTAIGLLLLLIGLIALPIALVIAARRSRAAKSAARSLSGPSEDQPRPIGHA
ncbi:signal peptidase I [Streptacidiphilus sp. MAP12-16]|uniref:signal peptidase I n=1 Tax=Streptacidiphilus sp. MAP12-16 TaxID=3156300 RepID=UPI0035199B17